MIIGGKLAPGDVLPNEDVVSANLSVSRTAYREAVRILAAKGLVDTRPKAGTRITARERWNLLDPDVLSWHFEVEPSPTFIVSLFELRKIVEPAACALAAQRCDRNDLDAMRRAIDKLRESQPGSLDGLDADLDFHKAILVAARNEPLLALSSVIGSTLRWSVRLKLTAEPRVFENTLGDHIGVMESIAARDAAEASARMTDLVTKALAETLEVLSAQAKR
ncbi:MAG: FadR family transcriptional regulator [Rhizobiales bacterium]|nr:FadR family transcriptional regulator [Hyphomicrobiales bacterium]